MAISFRSNLILLITAVIVVLNLAVYVGSKLILADSFEQLERASVEENIHRAVNAINSDLEGLGRLCTDWSAWDDTYDFIENNNAEYIGSNLVDSTFLDLHLNAMLFFNAESRLVFGKAMDLAEENVVAVPADLLSEITRHQDLWQPTGKPGNLEGIILLPDGPMLVSSRPILTSKGEGPQRGILVMARWFDQGVIAQLAERTALSLYLQPLAGHRRIEQLAQDQKTTVMVDPETTDIIWGRYPLYDVDGRPALILSVAMNRDVYNQGLKTISFFLKSFLLFTILAGGTLYALIIKNREEYDLSERRFRNVFENTTDGLFVVDSNGNIKLINSAAKNLLGLPGPTFSLASITDLAEGESFAEFIKDALAGHIRGPLDLSLYDDTRKLRRYLRANVTPLIGKKNKLIGAVGTIHDVTRLKEADLLKNEFIATAAHELNTPLASIMGYAELLLSHEYPDETLRQKFLSTIIERSEALEKIIVDLLDLGKIESGGEIVLERSYYDLRSSVDQLLASCRHKTQQHHFENNLPGGQIEIIADRHRLNQVFDNLLGNAIKYSPDGGTIQVRGAWAEDEFVLCIEDQGIGMREDHLERIFDKFYRADNVRSLGGLGLGLNITKNIIEKHGGRIWIESSLGHGTKVFFTLPR